VTAGDLIHEIVPGDRWLVVVAHPDDETFGCGSIVADVARRGATVSVLCATRGESGERTPEIPPEADLGEVRTQELYEAASLLGVADVKVLDYRDSGSRSARPPLLCIAPSARPSTS
jgi:N-acetyl-1-D-myo-inositol-2-amino-2-deoxy-alpha-D-glucopyranoside deacetylase